MLAHLPSPLHPLLRSAEVRSCNKHCIPMKFYVLLHVTLNCNLCGKFFIFWYLVNCNRLLQSGFVFCRFFCMDGHKQSRQGRCVMRLITSVANTNIFFIFYFFYCDAVESRVDWRKNIRFAFSKYNYVYDCFLIWRDTELILFKFAFSLSFAFQCLNG